MGTFDISFYTAQAIGSYDRGLVKILPVSRCFFEPRCLCLLSLLSALFFNDDFFPPIRQNNVDRTRPHLSGLRIGRNIIGLSGFILTRSFSIVLFRFLFDFHV